MGEDTSIFSRQFILDKQLMWVQALTRIFVLIISAESGEIDVFFGYNHSKNGSLVRLKRL